MAFHIIILSLDPAEVPMCEISLACDNLLCDGHGRPPTPVLEIDVQSKSSKTWIKYARTEVVEVSAISWIFFSKFHNCINICSSIVSAE